jgi:hypothetical protein
MAILSLSLLFAGAAVAHMGIKTIVIDGVMYVSSTLGLKLISYRLLATPRLMAESITI